MGAATQPGRGRPSREGEEIWELTVPGRVWVEITNERGKAESVSVGGRAGARLRISSDDRVIAQERVVDAECDPFTNGMLTRVDADQQADEKTASPNALSTEDLMKLFAVSGRKFSLTVDGLNEVAVRRMSEMAESVDATASQIAYLKSSIETRWPTTSGDTPTYREMQAAPM